jgi:hypothetical protein
VFLQRLSSPRLGNRVQFLVRGEAALGFFGIGQAAVNGDFEDAAAAGRQAEFGAEAVLNPVPRTEGCGFVVSHLAVFNIDLHLFLRVQDQAA